MGNRGIRLLAPLLFVSALAGAAESGTTTYEASGATGGKAHEGGAAHVGGACRVWFAFGRGRAEEATSG